MDMSPPRFRRFSIAKLGNAESENEDQIHARITRPGRRGEIATIALSDGATESAFAREWADILVRSSWPRDLIPSGQATKVHELPKVQVHSWLREAREQLAARTANLLLPWYGRAKAREGAAASFLGLRIAREQGKRRWIAVACGDTCLFHLSSESGPLAFPLDVPEAFGNRPLLVPSSPAYGTPSFTVRSGTWKGGDTFVVATDALAAWLLDGRARPGRCAELMRCEDDQAFTGLVEQERAAGRLKNDDTTAVIFCP